MKIRASLVGTDADTIKQLKKVYTINDGETKIIIGCRFHTVIRHIGQRVRRYIKKAVVQDIMILYHCGDVWNSMKIMTINLPLYIEKDFDIRKNYENEPTDEQYKVLTRYAPFINTIIKEDIDELCFYMEML